MENSGAGAITACINALSPDTRISTRRSDCQSSDSARRVGRQEAGAKIARVASGQDRFCRHDKPQTAVRLPPTPAGIVESDAGIGKRPVPLLRAYIEILGTDAQHTPAFVLKQPILRTLDRNKGADGNMRFKPVLNRLLGLIVVGRQLLGTPFRLLCLDCLLYRVVWFVCVRLWMGSRP